MVSPLENLIPTFRHSNPPTHQPTMGSSWSGSGSALGSGCMDSAWTPAPGASKGRTLARGALIHIGHDPETDTAVMTFLLVLGSACIRGTLRVSMNTDYVDLSQVDSRSVKMTINDPAQILDHRNRPLIVVMNDEFSKLKSMIRPTASGASGASGASAGPELIIYADADAGSKVKIFSAPAADVRARPVKVTLVTFPPAPASAAASGPRTITV